MARYIEKILFSMLKENEKVSLILISNRLIKNKKILEISNLADISIPKWPTYFSFLPASIFICIIF